MDAKQFVDILQQESDRLFMPFLETFRGWTDAEVLANRQVLRTLASKWVYGEVIAALDRGDYDFIELATEGKEVANPSPYVRRLCLRVIRQERIFLQALPLLCTDERRAVWIAKTYLGRFAMERTFQERLEPHPVGMALLLCMGALESPYRPDDRESLGPKNFPALKNLLTLLRLQNITSKRPRKYSNEDQQAVVLEKAWTLYRGDQGTIRPTGDLKRIRLAHPDPAVGDRLYQESAPAILADLKVFSPILEGKTETLPHRVYQAIREDWKKWGADKRTVIDREGNKQSPEEYEWSEQHVSGAYKSGTVNRAPSALSPSMFSRVQLPRKLFTRKFPDGLFLFELHTKLSIEAYYRTVKNHYGKEGCRYLDARLTGATQEEAARKAGFSRTTGWRIDAETEKLRDRLEKDARDFQVVDDPFVTTLLG